MGEVVCNYAGLELSTIPFDSESKLDVVVCLRLVDCDPVARFDIITAEINDSLILLDVQHGSLHHRVHQASFSFIVCP